MLFSWDLIMSSRQKTLVEQTGPKQGETRGKLYLFENPYESFKNSLNSSNPRVLEVEELLLSRWFCVEDADCDAHKIDQSNKWLVRRCVYTCMYVY